MRAQRLLPRRTRSWLNRWNRQRKGQVTAFYAPAAQQVALNPIRGDFWMVTDGSNRMMRFNGVKWLPLEVEQGVL